MGVQLNIFDGTLEPDKHPGPQGATGATGPSGGPTGPVGATGATGPTGVGATGATGPGGGATCASAPELLCLSGRTGTTNDPLISTDDTGSIYGTGLSGTAGFNKGLALNAVAGTEIRFNAILLNPHANTITGLGAMLACINNFTLNDQSAPFGFNANFVGFLLQGTWTVGDDSQGGPKTDFFQFKPVITNPTGVAKILTNASTIFSDTTTYLADGAACSITNHHQGYVSNPIFNTSNGGTLSVNEITNYQADGTVDSGVTLTGAHAAFNFVGLNGSGTVNDTTAFLVNSDAGITVNGIWASFRSLSNFRVMRHVGAAVFGADAIPTNTNVGLELQSTSSLVPVAFLVSRMSTSDKNAMTPVNGMIVYDSTLDKFQGYEAGAWTNLI